MKNIQVVLAEDHQLIRESLRDLLQGAADIQVVGEACNGFEALELVETLLPDVLLLDMEMPGLSGVQVARRLQATHSSVRILALSGHDDEHYVQGVLAVGASGYLVKGDTPPAVIIEAVRGAVQGQSGWFSRWAHPQQMPSQASKITRLEPRRPKARQSAEDKPLKRAVIRKKIDSTQFANQAESTLGSFDLVSRVKAAIRALQEGLA